MKYWIVPSIMEFSFLFMAIFLCWILLDYTQSQKPEPGIVMTLGAVILSFVAIGSSVGDGDRLKHHKRILQKHGLWQEEEIKKKDLPKTGEK